jgi:hypothetical protein
MQYAVVSRGSDLVELRRHRFSTNESLGGYKRKLGPAGSITSLPYHYPPFVYIANKRRISHKTNCSHIAHSCNFMNIGAHVAS